MAITFAAYSATPTTTTATTIGGYTTATGVEAVVIDLKVANTSTGAVQYCDVLRHNGTTGYYLLRAAPVPPQSALPVIGGDAPKVVLASGYGIQFVPYATTGLLDVTMSVLEKS